MRLNGVTFFIGYLMTLSVLRINSIGLPSRMTQMLRNWEGFGRKK
jgi:hypothetical protein